MHPTRPALSLLVVFSQLCGAADIIHRDFGNSLYVGTLAIGDPPQAQRLQFDTGSSDFWIAGQIAACGKQKYNHSASSTYIPNGTAYFSGVYGSGDSYRGFFSTDTVSLGGFNLPNVTFAEITNVSDPEGVYIGQPYDGIIGLAWPALSDGGTVPLTALLGQLPEPVFSFYLGNCSAGELVLGGIDHSRYRGALSYVPLSAATYWQLDIDHVSVGGIIISSTRQSTIIDTGTPQICGPAAAVSKIAAAWSAREKGGVYAVNCSAAPGLPPLVFMLAQTPYVLNVKDVIVSHGIDDQCELGLVAQDGPPDWAFGDVFMRKYLTVFDAGHMRMGFAEAE